MPSEFEFLRPRWPKLAALGADSSRLVESSAVSALVTMRTFCEWVVDISLDILNIPVERDAPQVERIELLKESGEVPTEILAKLHRIRTSGNRAVNEFQGDRDEARICMVDMLDIANWLMDLQDDHNPYNNDRYVSHRSPYESPSRQAESRGYRQRQYRSEEPEEEEREYRTSPRQSEGGFSGRIPLSTFNGRSITRVSEIGHRFFSGPSRRNNIIFAAIIALLVIAIIVVIAIGVSQCSARPAASAVPSAAPTATATVLVSPSPSPTPVPPTTVTLDSLTPTTNFSTETLYFKEWDLSNHQGKFIIGERFYESGLGMFVPSRTITEVSGSVAAEWNLEGKYGTLSFDLGADTEWDNSADNGTYRVVLYADGNEVYNSEYCDNQSFHQNVVVDLGYCQTLRLELTQRKGSKGTLNVVMGDAILSNADMEGNVPEGAAAPSASPTPSAEASASPAPSSSPASSEE